MKRELYFETYRAGSHELSGYVVFRAGVLAFDDAAISTALLPPLRSNPVTDEQELLGLTLDAIRVRPLGPKIWRFVLHYAAPLEVAFIKCA